MTQEQWRACVRRMLRCKLACLLPPSSLDPRLASGAFAVAKDEGRDRFIGDRRPLNSRERSIGRAHMPGCPQLRRMIPCRSETVQSAIRNTKVYFFLYEVPPSRAAKKEIGPRIPQSWLEHVDDESLDVIDTAEIETWISQDLLKTCDSVELVVSELDNFQIWMTAIVMGDVNAVYTLECAHRRHLLAARARTIFVDQRAPLPAH